MKIMVMNGSVREGRRADKVQAWVASVLGQNPELELDVVDLKEVDLPFFNEAVTPDMAKGQFKNPKGTAWAQRVAAADAFVIITPEYNHGPSAVLKNAIDWVYDGWLNKVVGFVSYGGLVGGARAVEQLKQNALHVKLYPISSNVHIPRIGEAFDDSGKPVNERLEESLKNMLDELVALSKKLAG